MNEISSPQNPRIKQLVQLHRSRGRQRQNRIAIFGAREVQRAIASGVQPDELFLCIDVVDGQLLKSLRQCIANFDAVAFSLNSDLFDKICYGDRSDGIVMTANRPDRLQSDFFAELESMNPLVAVAESLEKPGNLGAIMRSADGAAIDGLIVADGVTDWFHPNTIRASLGTCFSIQGWVESSKTVRERLVDEGFQIVVASLQSEQSFYDLDLTTKTAVVLGSEAHGVSEVWREQPCVEVSLPMLGIADSLNVSVAAAVMFYEAHRQRLFKRES